MRSILLILSLGLGVAIFGSPSVDTVSGTWKITGDVAGNAVDQTCTFKQEDKKLTGACKSPSLPDVTLTGAVDNKNINWTFNTDYNGTAITLTFTGTLDDALSNAKGKIDVAPFGVEGEFTAKKDAAK